MPADARGCETAGGGDSAVTWHTLMLNLEEITQLTWDTLVMKSSNRKEVKGSSVEVRCYCQTTYYFSAI